MSSVLVEYPEGLPAPMTGNVSMTERRKASSIGGRQNFRTFQRDRHGTRSVAFVLNPTQSLIFREWWKEWLQLGGGWFAASWPLPWTREPSVFRFQEPPQWTLMGGGLNGQGWWRVTAIVEIRGRGMLPTAEVLYLTSIPYPVVYVEAIGASGDTVRESPTIYPPIDSVGVSAYGLMAEARSIFQKYGIAIESVAVSAKLTGATAVGTIYSTIHRPPEAITVSAKIAGATAAVILVVYKNYKPEGVIVSANISNITATKV